LAIAIIIHKLTNWFVAAETEFGIIYEGIMKKAGGTPGR
jgi:hypothetical protein